MQTNSKAAFNWRLLLSVTIFGFIISCENPSSVGDTIIPQPGISFDTLLVNGFDQDSLTIRAGNLTFVPVGDYDDQLFGSITNTAFFRPSISFRLDTTIDANWDVKLQLVMDSTQIYGDTLSGPSDFEVYDILENWRGNELMMDQNLAYDAGNPFTTFSMDREDTVIVDMPASWRDRFAVFANDTTNARDSLYTEQFFGFAIGQSSVPSKMRGISPNDVSLLLINNTEEDTTNIPMRSWGYEFNRSAQNIPAQRILLHNTLESFYKLNLSELTAGVETESLIRAELILTADKTSLDATLPINHTRNDIAGIDLFTTEEPPSDYVLQFTGGTIAGFYVEEDNTFRFDVTRFVEGYLLGNISDRELYMSLSPANGSYQSTLIYDSSVSGFEPKIVIISAEGAGS